ncbi:hypothetical protein CspeluHIS016_0305400 [Cutaneotrichosporon spelunceum]|uniref:Fluoride ion transporter CrcB n=1 Tax=Cutaneotrichosporon spelunceum TaxID=1672016 RepID=A0AAD3TTP2_9TREE|nr:hypothetical protein CspeluHIS016_0305400 [Cutaneotrichosporon spelunceum]
MTTRAPDAGATTPSEECGVDHVSAATPPTEYGTLRTGAHYASLVLSSMLGTLIRLGLNAMGDYDGRVIFPLAWAQGVGCGIMGLGAARKAEVAWIYPPITTFVTTGVAGSTTTFSSWMLEGFEAFADTPAGPFQKTVNGVAYSLATFAVSYAGIVLGEQVSSFFPSLPRPRPRPSSSGRHSLSPAPLADGLMFLLALASYAAAFAMYFAAPRSWRERAVFALLLSPPGAMIRYALSKLNTRSVFVRRFPIGTFIANMAATLVIGGVYAAGYRPADVSACDAFHALESGFCGCLSTVSTFVVEARNLRHRWAWGYVLGSVVVGHLMILATAGGVRWAIGYTGQCAGSGST